jgi:hypothetical protein
MLSRVFTNCDVALLAVLCEAQEPSLFKMTRRICLYKRGKKFVNVIESPQPISQYIAQLSFSIATTKFTDHAADKDGIFRLSPKWITNRILQKMKHRINDANIWKDIGKQIDQQTELEKQEHDSFYAYSAPTESVAALVFQHTAVLTRRFENFVPLYHIGTVFGKAMYFVDSYQDYVKDIAKGKFNALSKCCPPDHVQEITVQILNDCCETAKVEIDKLVLAKQQPFCNLIIKKFEWFRSNIAELEPRSFSKKRRRKLFFRVNPGKCFKKSKSKRGI